MSNAALRTPALIRSDGSRVTVWTGGQQRGRHLGPRAHAPATAAGSPSPTAACVQRCSHRGTRVPKHIPTFATRVAVVASSTAAAALIAVLPAPTAAVAPAPVAPASSAAAPVERAVAPVALATPAPAVVPSATTASAMNSALSKIGAPYRWGAAGPNAFDCSGLVNWAFRSVGIPLPRTSRAMSRVGTPVAKADLLPGDLVFFYWPVSHVGIYIGDGKIVHASSRRSPVKISDIDRMPFNSARRL